MWKLGLAVVVLLSSFGVGWYYGSGQKEVQVITKEGKTTTIVKDKIITKIVEVFPDGTRKETTKEEESSRKETIKETITDTGTPVKEDYRVGAAYWVRNVSDVMEPGHISNGLSVSLSRRVAGPIWVEVQGRPSGNRKELAVGVAIQW